MRATFCWKPHKYRTFSSRDMGKCRFEKQETIKFVFFDGLYILKPILPTNDWFSLIIFAIAHSQNWWLRANDIEETTFTDNTANYGVFHLFSNGIITLPKAPTETGEQTEINKKSRNQKMCASICLAISGVLILLLICGFVTTLVISSGKFQYWFCQIT